MTDLPGQPGGIPDEMSEYLQVFMDETDEQLEGLTETLLVLEREPDDTEHLNEAFRLIHSIKGSAGMMGLDSITALTHHLESRFERFRSGVEKLDQPTMNLVLRCIDFLRECVRRLRAGDQLGSAAELLQELSDRPDTEEPPRAETTEEAKPVAPEPEPEHDASPPEPPAAQEGRHLVVRFEPGLPLVDLKARLILTRLSNLGDIVSHRPSAAELEAIDELDALEVVLVTEADAEAIRETADVDGVRAVELDDAGGAASPEEPAAGSLSEPEPEPEPEPAPAADTPAEPDVTTPPPTPATPTEAAPEPEAEPEPAPESAPEPRRDRTPAVAASRSDAAPPDRVTPRSKPAETMRVDIDRLDSLMNLAGELVVNRARFVQVASQVAPAFDRRRVTDRMREFGDSLRRTIEHLEGATNSEPTADVEELKAGLELLEEHAELWDSGRRGFAHIGEAIDQLTRISNSLQQSVLDTRMVPVAPLFNRFKRVVRDLSTERGKHVDLQILGEKTELDKRMIDEL
ncbi:MAG: Hpt domain-containing protein, partial [Planctomycetota bacterium]